MDVVKINVIINMKIKNALEVRLFNKIEIKCYIKSEFIVKEMYSKNSPIGYGRFVKREFNN